MAYQEPQKPNQEMFPTFTPGYHYEYKYHNIGQLMTPYRGKSFGKGGDYAPPQMIQYYTPENRTYPYVLDKDFNPVQYLPCQGSCYGKPGYYPCYESQYPDYWIPPDYFSPHTRYASGHQPSKPSYDIFTNEIDSNPGRPTKIHTKENYTSDKQYLYKKLPVAHPKLKGVKDFSPFNNYY